MSKLIAMLTNSISIIRTHFLLCR